MFFNTLSESKNEGLVEMLLSSLVSGGNKLLFALMLPRLKIKLKNYSKIDIFVRIKPKNAWNATLLSPTVTDYASPTTADSVSDPENLRLWSLQWLTLWQWWFTGITCHNSLTLFTSHRHWNSWPRKCSNISQWTRTAKTHSREVKSLTFIFCCVVQLRYLALLVIPVRTFLSKPRLLW